MLCSQRVSPVTKWPRLVNAGLNHDLKDGMIKCISASLIIICCVLDEGFIYFTAWDDNRKENVKISKHTHIYC